MRTVPPNQTAFVARDPAMWQGFAGLCLTPGGRLVLGVKQAYGHGASRWQRVAAMTSGDRGRTWTPPETLAEGDFDRGLPFVATGGLYLTALGDRRVLMHYFSEGWPERRPTTPLLRISDDAGETWSPERAMTRGLEFRQDGAILERRGGELLVYTGLNRLLRSLDRGLTWEPFGDPVVPEGCPLQLGEVCLAETNGRLVILMRENHYANFPMFAAHSEDGGRTWSRPRPTPFIGHWPAAFDLGDGTHLLAYRNVGGRANSVVWRGDLGDLPGYQVSSCRYPAAGASPARLVDEGLLLQTDEDPGAFAQFFLTPADDPAATVVLEAEVRCLANAGQACSLGLRGAGWLRIFPDHIDLEHIPGHSRVAVTGDQLAPLPPGARAGGAARPGWTAARCSPVPPSTWRR